MAGLTVNFDVLNQLNTPTLYADTLALRPAPAIVGRIFFRTDSPYGIYRDTGTAWDLVASPDTTGITGTLAAGQVPYATGASTIAGTNNLFWDAATNHLGIGTTTPGTRLDIHGTGNTLVQLNGTGTTNSFLVFQNAGTGKWRIGNNYSGGTNFFTIHDNTNNAEILQINAGTTALNSLTTLRTIQQNTSTQLSIAAATTINYNQLVSNTTYNSGITRSSTFELGIYNVAAFTFSGTFTKSFGSMTTEYLESQFSMNGNVTYNQPAYILPFSASSIGMLFSGSGTMSHYANIITRGDFLQSGSVTVTNRYQILVNNITSIGGGTYTNRWGIYQEGTSDNNYFAGKLLLGTTSVGTTLLNVNGTSLFQDSVAIGSTSFSNVRLAISKSLTGSSTYFNIYTEGSVQSDVVTANYFGTYATVQNTAFTLSNLRHFYAQGSGSFGSATVTNQYAYFAESTIIGATNNYGFYGAIAAGTGRWNLYMAGTASNYMNGVLTIGTASPNASAKVQIDTTTQGFLPPRMTTTQKNAIATPAAGLVIFDTTLAKLCVYSGAGWETITSV